MQAITWNIGTILLWLIAGSVAGWLTSMLIGPHKHLNTGTNILIGLIGAVIGGVVMKVLSKPGTGEIDLLALVVAFFCALILVVIINVLKTGQNQ